MDIIEYHCTSSGHTSQFLNLSLSYSIQANSVTGYVDTGYVDTGYIEEPVVNLYVETNYVDVGYIQDEETAFLLSGIQVYLNLAYSLEYQNTDTCWLNFMPSYPLRSFIGLHLQTLNSQKVFIGLHLQDTQQLKTFKQVNLDLVNTLIGTDNLHRTLSLKVAGRSFIGKNLYLLSNIAGNSHRTLTLLSTKKVFRQTELTALSNIRSMKSKSLVILSSLVGHDNQHVSLRAIYNSITFIQSKLDLKSNLVGTDNLHRTIVSSYVYNGTTGANLSLKQDLKVLQACHLDLSSHLYSIGNGRLLACTYDKLAYRQVDLEVSRSLKIFKSKVLDLSTSLIISDLNHRSLRVSYENLNFTMNSLILKYSSNNTNKVLDVAYSMSLINSVNLSLQYNITTNISHYVDKTHITSFSYPNYLDGNLALWDNPQLPYIDGGLSIYKDDTNISNTTYLEPFNKVSPGAVFNGSFYHKGPAEVEFINGIFYINNLPVTDFYQVIDNLQVQKLSDSLIIYSILDSLELGYASLNPIDLDYGIDLSSAFTLNFRPNRDYSISSQNGIVSSGTNSSSPVIPYNQPIPDDFDFSYNPIIDNSTVLYPELLKPVSEVFSTVTSCSNWYYDGVGFKYLVEPLTEPITTSYDSTYYDALNGIGDILAVGSISSLYKLNSQVIHVIGKELFIHPNAKINPQVSLTTRELVIPESASLDYIALSRSEYKLAGIVKLQDTYFWAVLLWDSQNNYKVISKQQADISRVSSLELRTIVKFNKFI